MEEDPVQAPDVSVVVAAWQAEATIGRAIESALGQRDVTVEVVVVDDGSSDRTGEVARAVVDPRLRVLRMPRNSGPGAARAAGFACCSGKWLAVLDSDDSMRPERLAALVAAAETEGADVVIDDLLRVSERGEDLGPFFGSRLEGVRDLESFILQNADFFAAPALGYAKPVLRRDLLLRHRIEYRAELSIGEDYMLLADCLAAGAKVTAVPRALYLYTSRRESASARLRVADLEAMRAADRAFAARWQLAGRSRVALERRERKLADAIAFVRAVECLKRGDWMRASSEIARRPTAALLFHHPIRARLDRLFRAVGGAAPPGGTARDARQQ